MPQLIAGGRNFEVEALLLDKDGTLLDFIYTWGAWSRRFQEAFTGMLEARGLEPLTKEELGEAWGLTFRPDGSAASYDRNGPLSGGYTGRAADAAGLIGISEGNDLGGSPHCRPSLLEASR